MALIINVAPTGRRDSDPPYPILERGARVASLVECAGLGFPVSIGYQGRVIDQPTPDLIAILFDCVEDSGRYVYLKPEHIEPVDWVARRTIAEAGAAERVDLPVVPNGDGAAADSGVPECCASARPGPPTGPTIPEGLKWACPTCLRTWVHIVEESAGAWWEPTLDESWSWPADPRFPFGVLTNGSRTPS